METLWPKKVVFFKLESVVNKVTFNFHPFNKITDFATTQYATTIFYLFYQNPLSWPNENGMDKAQFSW